MIETHLITIQTSHHYDTGLQIGMNLTRQTDNQTTCEYQPGDRCIWDAFLGWTCTDTSKGERSYRRRKSLGDKRIPFQIDGKICPSPQTITLYVENKIRQPDLYILSHSSPQGKTLLRQKPLNLPNCANFVSPRWAEKMSWVVTMQRWVSGSFHFSAETFLGRETIGLVWKKSGLMYNKISACNFVVVTCNVAPQDTLCNMYACNLLLTNQTESGSFNT